MKQSAGILLYVRSEAGISVLIVHPSGAYNRNAPYGIPKGEPNAGEALEAAARREVLEETGVDVTGELRSLDHIDYTRSKKRIHAWAAQLPVGAVPKCASWEIDKAEVLPIEDARKLIHKEQAPFLDRLLALLLVTLVALCASGCFYDSSWGSVKRAQSHNAAHATPAKLNTDDDDRRAARARTYKVRAYVTDRYASQEIEWDRRIRDVIDGANEVLAPALGIKLEIDGTTTWKDLVSENDLPKVLEALHAKDDGASTDWVAGFVGSIPQMSESFHDAGYGDVIGKHFVVRASATERAEIDAAFNELGAAEREKLARARKRHRAVAVLLHEVGHTLGALHERDAASIMNGRYDPNMAGFSEEAVALMRVSVDHRDKEQTEAEKHAYASGLVELLEPGDTGWVDSERVAMLARLRTQTTPSVVAQKPADDFPGIHDADRDAWQRAVKLQRDGELMQAWTIATPLFKTYPTTYAVQDLRCTLAMKVVGWPGAQPECESLMKLSRNSR